MVGLVHPCKIYNILTVGAPVICIGPQASHVTEILDRLGTGHSPLVVAHGEAEILVRRVRDLQAQRTVDRQCPAQVTAAFAKGGLLSQLIAALEN